MKSLGRLGVAHGFLKDKAGICGQLPNVGHKRVANVQPHCGCMCLAGGNLTPGL